MAENSKIEWTDHTFNPWEGCQKVGPGCDHCYAETRNARFGGGVAVNWGPGAPRRRTSAANWKNPIKWNAEHEKFFIEHGRRQRVFCASLADVFDNAVSAQWRFDLMRLIEQTPNLDWLLLTKRIGNAAPMLEQAVRAINAGRWGWEDNIFPNVWIGATVVNQEEADRDIPKLLQVPAAKRFLSMEPLLGPVDLRFTNGLVHGCDAADYLLDWVIVGGESGPGARPMHPDWPRSLRDQCRNANVEFLFKQWGEWWPLDGRDDEAAPCTEFADDAESASYHGDAPAGVRYYEKNPALVHVWPEENSDRDCRSYKVGKKAAGRMLDGHTLDAYPVRPV